MTAFEKRFNLREVADDGERSVGRNGGRQWTLDRIAEYVGSLKHGESITLTIERADDNAS